MTAHATVSPLRRGACPGLSEPMPTGDGLLVRLLPIGTIALSAFAGLCAAARTHGNGVVEITSRGSIQVRGLSAASAPRFATDIAALGIAAQDGIPIHCNALAGLDAAEVFDGAALAAELRRALARRSLPGKFGAKVCVAIDGGGALDLAALSADIRLKAEVINGSVALRVSIAGDEANATDLGLVAPADAVETVMRLLDVLAQRGRDVRARDILATEGAAVFHSALSSYSQRDVDGRDKPGHDGGGAQTEAIGLHYLRDGSFACGIGLPFGHADARLLERLANAALRAGASGLRAAPGRVLMTIGLARETAADFAAAAGEFGFIVRADDRRRSVIACAGAPICASAHITARAIAPLVADAVMPHIEGLGTIHISGCSKGCARAAPAALTVVGTPDGCALVAEGSARGTPFAVVATGRLPAAIARYAREHKRAAGHV
jgi:precorrin-3B synthase